MRLTRRLGRLRGTSDAGVSLVELLVVIVLLGTVGAVASGGMIQSMRTTRQGQARSYAVSDLQKGIERLSREVRVADPVRVATDNGMDLQVDIYRSGKCQRLRWTLNGTTLEHRSRADLASCATYPSPLTSAPTPFLVGVGNGATPVFTYYNRLGQQLTQPSRATKTNPIAQVRIVLVRTVPEGRAPIRVETWVDLRNVA